VAQNVVSRDRMILETQVLSARSRVKPDEPLKIADPEFLKEVKAYVEDRRAQDPAFAQDDQTFKQVLEDLHKSYTLNYRSIRVGDYRDYWFTGLAAARQHNTPLTLRYTIDSGSNDPTAIYKITFMVEGVLLPPQEVGLGQPHTVTFYPSVVDDEGRVGLRIINGAVVQAPDGSMQVMPNPDLISFQPNNLELFYTAGTYQGNFFRVAAILWVKLAFLSMLAIAASTFLSFPVACLIAFSVFIGAEGSGFLKNSLEYYSAADLKGNVNPLKVVIRAVGLAVAGMFSVYSNLKPTTRLVDGRLLTWSSMAFGTAVLLAWTGALFGLAVAIFRRRELATYSGH
jgi:hypothetical protein